MSEASGYIGRLLGRAAPGRTLTGRSAAAIGESPVDKSVGLTVVERQPETGAWMFRDELQANLQIVTRRLSDATMTAFHRLEVTLPRSALSQGDPIVQLSLVVAEMPIGNYQVFAVPFQSTGGSTLEAPLATLDFALLNPTGYAALQPSDAAGMDVLRAIAQLTIRPDDPYLSDKLLLRASIPMQLVEASLWPPQFTHTRPFTQVYDGASRRNTQRFAVVMASLEDLPGIHAEILGALSEKCAELARSAGGSLKEADHTLTEFIHRQAKIAVWQALAGCDLSRGFGSGSRVDALAKLYLDHTVTFWLRTRFPGSIHSVSDVPEVEAARVQAELFRILGEITDPQDERSMLTAVREAIEEEHVFLPAAEAERLLGRVMRRLNEL